MASEMFAAGIDTAIDTAAFQQNMNNGQKPSLFMPLVGLGMWSGFAASSYLKKQTDPFNKATPGLFKDMKRAGGATQRRSMAMSYYERNAAKMTGLAQASNAAQFAKTAESAYMRRAAGFAIGRAATLVNAGFFIAPFLFGASYHGFKGLKKLGYELETPHFGGHFVLNAAQATDRQRSIMAMHNSEFNGRRAIGNEAFLMHQ